MTKGPLSLTRAQILAHRRAAGALDERLPPGPDSLRSAGWAGLQDSMPRAALLSIHARVDGTEATAWEDPAFVQVWGPRFSAYVVPADDLALFTLGRLPDPGRARTVAEETADRLEAFLAGRSMSANEAGRGLGVHPNAFRYAAPTGRVLIRWDGANRPTIWTVPAPKVDPLDARAELARRYLHVLGPGTPETFAEWAGIKPPRGRAAFEAIADSLTAVKTPIGDGWILAEDEASFSAPPRPTRRRSTPPQRRRLLPAPGIRSRAPGAAGGPPERPVDLPRLAGRACWSTAKSSGSGDVPMPISRFSRGAGSQLRNASPWKRKRRRSRSPASRARSGAVGRACVMVGARGFEPPTPWPPAKCAARLRHAPTERGSRPV